jgi:branched-chain amino acid transport system substrate-binding protein
VQYLKDPANPEWDNDAGMKLFRQIMAKYLPEANAKDQLYLYGMAKAYTFEQAFRKAGKNPTRASLMKSVLNYNEKTNPFALPGVVTKTGGSDAFPISQMRMIRFSDGSWRSIGQLLNGRGK